jgi:hypothetical protein
LRPDAAVEICDVETPARAFVAKYKEEFAERLAATAAEAGASDPRTLGRRLNLLFEGVTALSTSTNSADVFADPRATAEMLLDASLSASCPPSRPTAPTNAASYDGRTCPRGSYSDGPYERRRPGAARRSSSGPVGLHRV